MQLIIVCFFYCHHHEAVFVALNLDHVSCFSYIFWKLSCLHVSWRISFNSLLTGQYFFVVVIIRCASDEIIFISLLLNKNSLMEPSLLLHFRPNNQNSKFLMLLLLHIYIVCVLLTCLLHYITLWGFDSFSVNNRKL